MAVYSDRFLHDKNYWDEINDVRGADIRLLTKYSRMVNVADELESDFLRKIGEELMEQVRRDDMTRTEWFERYDEALKIARQTIEIKNVPFERAANVKIPLILQACVQFNARIMPEIIQDNKTVNVSIVGEATEADEVVADKIGCHMSLQTLQLNQSWVSDTDRLLMILPLVGTVFRKWCYNPITRRPESFLCLPTEIIVSNDVPSIEKAERITHVLMITRNEIIEKIRFGLFCEDCLKDVRLDDDAGENTNLANDDKEIIMPSNMNNSRDYYQLYEIHTWLDLDDDGYCEPYIVTLVKETKKICRIVARYSEHDFVFNSDKELIRINAWNYFVAHTFIPSPDGVFLGVGFGQMLLQLNAAINTITNELIDAGNLNNLGGGFFSKDLRLPNGQLSFVPGQFKAIDFGLGSGSIADYFYPLPTPQPSAALMELLKFLTDFGRQTANLNEVLLGSPQTASMPATSVVSIVEQGSKMFSSILTRLYESLKKEFNILFEINKRYIDLYPEEDLMVGGEKISPLHYRMKRFNIFPVANPAIGLDAVRLAKMRVLTELGSSPMIDKKEVMRRYLVALGIPEVDKVLISDQALQQPSPADILTEAQIKELNARTELVELRAAEIVRRGDLEAIRLDLEQLKLQIDAASKGGQLAIGKANAVAAITTAESKGTQNEAFLAQNIVDKEVAKSGISIDQSDVKEKIDETYLQGKQIYANVSQNQPQNIAGDTNPPQNKGGNVPVMQDLPPELDAALKQVAIEQKAGGKDVR